MLTIQALHKQFQQQDVLQGIDLHVQDGEIVALLGPSGSGKSTLLQCVGGILPPSSGQIFIDDTLINGESGHISYMPQHHCLLPWRTVLQNVLLAQELSGTVNKEEATEWIERIGLGDYLHAYPHEISGGMKQRISFLRALLSPQSLLCLDEPFSALDEITRHKMHVWLLEMWENRQKSILFITHQIDEALFLANRIYVLSDRPAKIKAEIQVPFPKKRTKELLETEEFFQARTQLLNLLME
ncbi:ABC transporter ATP-binding protein [Solibacillus sp. FSL K6-1523]|uniref:ABC transporter ATP-binding protein n=1 Tax=Solibacillus sp. FSL K6-1523 TaxID=2921471 RepID=UPI0030F71BD0